ncbi:MAG TPA: septum formation inhibitor Maf [Lachnospiraceae bacterium]|nr:septum formation inhibitor Maf [Lachnospiraceae bacterium]
MQKIILASSSPRRRQILENLSIPFEIINSEVDETIDVDNSPYEWVKTLSSKKANAVLDKVEGPAVIIGVDTVVADLGRILNKPDSKETAVKMLRQLQGRHHSVYTGMTLLFIDENGNVEEENFVDGTEVTFNKMTIEEIEMYLGTGEFTDKAGGYGIQGKASMFIDSITGNYDTVVGLPVPILYNALKQHGIQIMDFWK